MAFPDSQQLPSRFAWPSLALSGSLMMVGAAVAQALDLLNVIQRDSRIDSTLISLTATSFLPFILLLAYFRVYLGYIRKTRINWNRWEEQFPRHIQTASLSLVIGVILALVTFWPVWGLLTPFYLFCMALGVVGVLRLF
ncbi:hypothetical protein IWQ62_003560 [Dispira parvispora]|uniref:Uncharacterized protein n=1 Tax=Dispira parvispora TaxID=1520584 RepID=A0A9W8E6F4_9FUNG|nr:hypothetical protein IWQ62_003560 [Dispira parvispora]